MKKRKSVTYTKRQVSLIEAERKKFTVSFAEMVRQIIDSYFREAA